MALAAVPATEAEAVAFRWETRAKAQRFAWGLPSVQLTGVLEPGTLPRTVLLRTWFTEAIEWIPVRARHWHYPSHINIGETRALGEWQDTASAVAFGRRVEFVDLSDNSAAVGVTSRGRSSILPLNAICRRRAALEGLSQVTLRSTWVDTHHQPADGGTRPDSKGVLRLDRPTWLRHRRFLEVAGRPPHMSTVVEGLNGAVMAPFGVADIASRRRGI